jgi:hypothetical protein
MNILQVSGSFWIRPEFVKLAAAARSTDRVHTSRTYVCLFPFGDSGAGIRLKKELFRCRQGKCAIAKKPEGAALLASAPLGGVSLPLR